jgi:hypothetical protein
MVLEIGRCEEKCCVAFVAHAYWKFVLLAIEFHFMSQNVNTAVVI